MKIRASVAVIFLVACNPGRTGSKPAPKPEAAPTVRPAPPPADASRSDRKVFVTYLPWYETGPGWDHWKWLDHDPEQQTAGRRQIAAAHYPVIGPYDSRDEAVLGYHLMLLSAAGCDGAFVNWYGRGNRLDTATRGLFDKTAAWRAAYGLRFSLALMLDAEPYLGLADGKRADALAADLGDVLGTLAGRPEYQRLEGKPVLLWFPKPDPGDPGKPALSPAELADVRKRQTVPHWFATEHPDPTYRPAAELAYGWIAGGDKGDPADYGKTYLDWLYPAFAYQRTRGWELPIAIGIAYPGFDDGGVYAWTQDKTRRRQIARTIGTTSTLDATWDVLDVHGAEWLQVATFNDWNEGSEIEPSVEYGTAALDLVARRGASFKRGKPPEPSALDAAWKAAARYLELRRAGRAESDLAPALTHFFAGSYAETLAAMER